MSPTRRAFLQGGVAAICSPAIASDAPCPVLAADAFIHSIGVNTHLSSEPYRSRFDRLRSSIETSGIRYLRDELRPTNDLTRWSWLFKRLGVRAHLLVSPTTNSIPEMMRYLEAVGIESVAAIEGQNEGDSDWFATQPAAGGDWAATTVSYQKAAYESVRRVYPVDVLPVVSPTILDWKPEDAKRLRGVAPYCDVVAVHAYAQRGQQPETLDDYAALSWYLKTVRDVIKPGAPVMATEAGYNNVVRPRGSGISEAAAAAYLPRLLLTNFVNGVRRTFLYALMDGGIDPSDTELHWGLLRADGSPKPAFDAIGALIAGLDAKSSGTGWSKQIFVKVRDAPEDARCHVFRRRDGTLVAAVWRSVRCWDPAMARDVVVDRKTVRLTCPGLVRARRWDLRDDTAWRPADVMAEDVVIAVGASVVLVDLDMAL